MKDILNDDYESFLRCYEEKPLKGLRVNTIKCSVEKLRSLLDTELRQSPFSDVGFYIESDEKLGNNPLHHCGAFYIQEPSASGAVNALGIEPDDRVLDLCAAPGGKSTQIAALLGEKGFLWSNEIVKSRANILLSNIERMGIRNYVVSSLSPEKLCPKLGGYFDKILVDAPCSGEGMFRKDAQAVLQWSEEHTKSCMDRQLQILRSAKGCLKKGGILVYSTCTFSKYENEDVINTFLNENSDFELCDCGFLSFGREGIDMPYARRIYPMDAGEGHFIARLKRNSEPEEYTPDAYGSSSAKESRETKEIIKKSKELYSEIFLKEDYPDFNVINDRVMINPVCSPFFEGSGIVRKGILFGEVRKNRIEPSHQLFTCAKMSELRNVVDFDYRSEQINSYLLGGELETENTMKGYTAVCVNGMTLGFGKASGGRLKNKYPKGLRKVK